VAGEARAAAPAGQSTASGPAAGPTPDPEPSAPDAADPSAAPDSRPQDKARPAGSRWSVPDAVDHGAGFLLGLMFWAWVGLPFLRDGMDGVRDVLRAKFTNKAPDGTWLP